MMVFCFVSAVLWFFPLVVEQALCVRSWSKVVSAHLASLKANKVPISLAQLDEYYPHGSAAAIAASAYTNAFGNFETSKDVPVLGDDKMPAVGSPLTPTQRERIAECLARNAQCLALLRSAVGYGSCRYPIDLQNGWEVLLPHLGKLKGCGNLLAMEAVYYADSGDGSRAARSLLTCLQLAGSLDDEPLAVSYLVQTALLARACRTLEWCLSRCEFSVLDLPAIQERFRGFLSDRGHRRALVGERCMCISIFEGPTATLQKLLNDESVGTRRGLCVYRSMGFWMRDYQYCLDLIDQLQTIHNLAPHLRLDQIASLKKQVSANKGRSRATDVNLISGMILPSILGVAEKEIRRQTELRLALAALSLKLAQPTGELPPWTTSSSDTSSVTPLFMDPFDGEPLRLLKSDTGWVIYSVGPDRSDDEGRKKEKDSSNGPYDISFEIRQ